jgi:putative addiction module component (TIGR02574 family)
MNEPSSVFAIALGLPEDQRADLAQQLLLSLNPDDAPPEAQILHDSWKGEIASRSEAFHDGRLNAVDWKESIQNIRRRLSEAYEDQRAPS